VRAHPKVVRLHHGRRDLARHRGHPRVEARREVGVGGEEREQARAMGGLEGRPAGGDRRGKVRPRRQERAAEERVRAGDFAAARSEAGEALAIFRASRDRNRIAGALSALAYAARRAGQPAEAARLYLEVMATLGADGARGGLARAIEGLASSLVGLGRPEAGTPLFAAVHAFRARAGIVPPPSDMAEHDADIAAARAALGEAAFGGAWDRGRSMAFDEALAAAGATAP
jgi:hypothetical protein